MLYIVISSPSLAQQNNSAGIKGRITSSETGLPLEYANVFLANTTIGVIAGKNGEFVINNIPPGTYDIIFSYVGYEMQKENFQINNHEMLNFNISLKPKPMMLNQVEIVAAVPTDWRKNLELFKNLFIGETNNSGMTTILNPEVIHFSETKNSNVLKVTADSVLKIENKSLGYMIFVVLESFSYDKSNSSIKYTSYSRFHELNPESEKEKNDWENNRRKTYLNSPRYFFYQLVHRQIKNNYLLSKGSFDELRYREGIPVKEKDLYITTDKDSILYTFSFSENLRVVKRPGSETSVLTFYKPKTEIDKYGNFSKPFYTVEFNGYWSKQGIADALPKNYIYKEN
jgi:hypothetical protein